MSHMVIYRGSDGKPGYHQTDDIHDAVGFVEQMRNDQGVEHARIFRLEEVVFQYKPYYRVELAESGFAEVGGGTDSVANGSSHGSGNGAGQGSINESATGEPAIASDGADGDRHGNGNGSNDGVAVAKSTVGATASVSSDDDASSKKGLFGR